MLPYLKITAIEYRRPPEEGASKTIVFRCLCIQSQEQPTTEYRSGKKKDKIKEEVIEHKAAAAEEENREGERRIALCLPLRDLCEA
jgi:hypothetical protein